MRLRNLLMTVVFLLAVSASFASKTRKGAWEGAHLGPLCAMGQTNENFCSPTGTGPQCTITFGVDTYPAFKYSSGCSIPLYVQP